MSNHFLETWTLKIGSWDVLFLLAQIKWEYLTHHTIIRKFAFSSWGWIIQPSAPTSNQQYPDIMQPQLAQGHLFIRFFCPVPTYHLPALYHCGTNRAHCPSVMVRPQKRPFHPLLFPKSLCLLLPCLASRSKLSSQRDRQCSNSIRRHHDKCLQLPTTSVKVNVPCSI